MRIIINADDLGSNETVNDAVFSLMSENKISSATIMANGPSFDDAATRSKIYTDCSFGCHLNLTEFKPLTYSQIMYDYGIVDKNGFTGKLREIRMNDSLKKALFIELKQQVISLYDNKISVSHIDSHQHIHTLPELFFGLKKIQKEFNIRKVRISMNYYGPFYNPSIVKKTSKFLWNYLLRNFYKTKTSEYFTSVNTFVNDIRHSKDKVVELMCHPGSLLHKEETEKLKTDWLKNENLQLVSYNKL